MPSDFPQTNGERDLSLAGLIEPFNIVEKVTGATSAAVDLFRTIPANSIVTAVGIRLATAVTMVTGVKLGLGTSGDPDLLLLSDTGMTKNTATGPQNPTGPAAFVAATSAGSPTVALGSLANFGRTCSFASEQTVRITACDTNGAAAGTFAGDVDVYISGYRFKTPPSRP